MLHTTNTRPPFTCGICDQKRSIGSETVKKKVKNSQKWFKTVKNGQKLFFLNVKTTQQWSTTTNQYSQKQSKPLNQSKMVKNGLQ